ncbi:MAG: trehalose-phosphatase [Caldimonas sp.]
MPAHLFSLEGEAALAATMAREPLLAFDFDGTLAPIVARPGDARVPLAVARRLDRLARRLPVAIISGRRVDDVRGRLSFAPHFVIGNHGAEDPLASGGSPKQLDPVRARLAARATELVAAGVSVEDKGYSLALHYRLARDRHRACALVDALVAELGKEAITFGGKMVMNIVAVGAHDKADAVAGLVRRCGVEAAVFLGDDVNDEPVFARAEPGWLTVKIGRDDPASRASFCIDPTEVARLLDGMLDALARADAARADG